MPLDRSPQLDVAAELDELAQPRLELEAHVVAVRLVSRVGEPLGPDVAECVQAHLRKAMEDRADLAVQLHELALLEPLEQRLHHLSFDLRQDEQVLTDDRARVVGGEHLQRGDVDRTLTQQPIDVQLLLQLPVQEVGVELTTTDVPSPVPTSKTALLAPPVRRVTDSARSERPASATILPAVCRSSSTSSSTAQRRSKSAGVSTSASSAGSSSTSTTSSSS